MMKEDHTINRVTCDDDPVSVHGGCQRIRTHERELASHYSVTTCVSSATLAMNVSELKVTEAIPGKFNAAGKFFVNEILISLRHQRDSATTNDL
ncbi:MAG: hypothetical protein R3C01_17935 [Planctomycetaceae bacterium]